MPASVSTQQALGLQFKHSSHHPFFYSHNHPLNLKSSKFYPGNCTSIYPCIHSSIHPFTHSPIHLLSIHILPFNHSPTYQFVHLSTHLPSNQYSNLSTHLCIDVSIHSSPTQSPSTSSLSHPITYLFNHLTTCSLNL